MSRHRQREVVDPCDHVTATSGRDVEAAASSLRAGTRRSPRRALPPRDGGRARAGSDRLAAGRPPARAGSPTTTLSGRRCRSVLHDGDRGSALGASGTSSLADGEQDRVDLGAHLRERRLLRRLDDVDGDLPRADRDHAHASRSPLRRESRPHPARSLEGSTGGRDEDVGERAAEVAREAERLHCIHRALERGRARGRDLAADGHQTLTPASTAGGAELPRGSNIVGSATCAAPAPWRVQPFEDELRGLASELLEIAAHDVERWHVKRRDLCLLAGDDREVVRDANAEVAERGEHPGEELVVAGDDRGRTAWRARGSRRPRGSRPPRSAPPRAAAPSSTLEPELRAPPGGRSLIRTRLPRWLVHAGDQRDPPMSRGRRGGGEPRRSPGA